MTLEKQIAESDAKFTEAFNRGDFNAIELLYEDNAMLLLPDVPMTVGDGKAVVEGFQELWEAGWRNMSLS